MGDAATVHQAIVFGDLVVSAIAIALDYAVRPLEQTRGHLATAAGIVVEEDNPLSWRTGNPDPHPMLCGCWFFAVDDLHRRLIDADVAAAAQPLIHQVNQRLNPLGECDNPGGLRGPRKAHAV